MLRLAFHAKLSDDSTTADRSHVPDLQRLIELQQLETTIADAGAESPRIPQRLADADARLAEATQRSSREGAAEGKPGSAPSARERRGPLSGAPHQVQGPAVGGQDEPGIPGAPPRDRDRPARPRRRRRESARADGRSRHALPRTSRRRRPTLAGAAEGNRAPRRSRSPTSWPSSEAALEGARGARSARCAGRAAAGRDLRAGRARAQGHRRQHGHAGRLCSVCHVRLRPQVFQLVRQNDTIIQCDSCQRILYYVPPPPPAEAVTHTRDRSHRSASVESSRADEPTVALRAAAAGRPSPTSTAARAAIPGPAGYGVRIEREDGTIVELKESLGMATNNVAEYRGLLAALRGRARTASDGCTSDPTRCCW